VLEYARNRFFREAVVCKSGRRSAMDGTVGRMSGLWFSGTARRVATAPAFGFPAAGNAEQWRTPAGYGVGAKLPWQSAVLRALEAAIPGSVSFAALLSAARGAKPEVTDAELATYLWDLTLATDAIEPCTGDFALSVQVSDRPVACPLARAMAESGMDAVFGRGQQRWPLKPEWRELLLACDGRAKSELPGGAQREATLAAMARAGLFVP
jgi:hypothetical protein